MVTLTLGINTGAIAPNVYVNGNKVATAPNSGRMIFHFDVPSGIQKINTTDKYYDIEIYVGSDVNTAAVYYRMINSEVNPSKQNGIWFDTLSGYIKPSIYTPSNTCWDGFLVSSPDGVNMVDLSGTLIGQGVTPQAHPTYFLVSSLTSAYNFNNNTIDYSYLLPTTCPIISKNVTITGIDGQTLVGRLSILDFSNFGSSNINEGQFVVNRKGDSFFSNISDSTQPATLTAVDALNFISAHNMPVQPVAPYTIFQSGQTPIDIATTNPTQTSAIVNQYSITDQIITPDMVAPISLAGDTSHILVTPTPNSTAPAPHTTDIPAPTTDHTIVNNTNSNVNVPVEPSTPDITTDTHSFTPLTDPLVITDTKNTTSNLSKQLSPAASAPEKLDSIVKGSGVPMLAIAALVGAAVVGGVVWHFSKKSKSSKKQDDTK